MEEIELSFKIGKVTMLDRITHTYGLEYNPIILVFCNFCPKVY